ncbi:MAG: hypothetical protein WB760_26165 [Xanthobacteraceae bacterium]
MQSVGVAKTSPHAHTIAVPVCLVMAFAAAHLLLLDLPSVNMEWAFSDAAKYFSSGNRLYLDEYFDSEANTLAIPWLAFAIHWLVPALDINHIPRLLTDLGVPLLAFGLLRINRQLLEGTNPSLLISIVFLNPLVWTYSGRGTADFLPAALAVFAFSLFWDGDETNEQGIWRRMLASAVLGLAAVLKYHAMLLLAGVVAEIAIRRRWQYGRMVLESAASAIPGILIVSAYLLIVRIKFDFWVTPPAFQRQLGLNLIAAPDNFVSYMGYLALITFPLSFAVPWRWLRELRLGWVAVSVLGLTVAFAAGFFLLSDNGEMNLGPLDSYVNKHAANGFLVMLSVVCATCLAVGRDRSIFNAKGARLLGLEAAIIFFLLALSLSRPAQRYLLFVIPFFYLSMLLPRKHHRVMLASTILLSVVLDVYILLNQVASGVAQEEMAARIAERGLLSKTDPGPIAANVGDRFFPFRREKKTFAVVAGDVEGKIVGVRYSVFPQVPFIGKAYSLMPLQEAR